MLVFGVDLIVKGLDHVSDRDDADELPPVVTGTLAICRSLIFPSRRPHRHRAGTSRDRGSSPR